MQTKKFDYDSVPQGFAHCLNEQCPQSADCLRRKAALHIPTDCQFIKIVNPTYTPEMNAKCPYYRSGETVRFACGVAHLYDNLPHNAAVAIKRSLLYYFGRSGYYRFYRKESLLNPKDQAFVRQTFRRYGITSEPAYDGFVDKYAWW